MYRSPRRPRSDRGGDAIPPPPLPVPGARPSRSKRRRRASLPPPFPEHARPDATPPRPVSAAPRAERVEPVEEPLPRHTREQARQPVVEEPIEIAWDPPEEPRRPAREQARQPVVDEIAWDPPEEPWRPAREQARQPVVDEPAIEIAWDPPEEPTFAWVPPEPPAAPHRHHEHAFEPAEPHRHREQAFEPAEQAFEPDRPRREPVLLPHQVQRVLDAVRAVAAQPNILAATTVLRRNVGELTASERVYCLFRHPKNGTLWSLDGEVGPRPPTDAGLTTFAARTGTPVATARAGDLPLYCPDLDDPYGDGSERMLVQPVASAGVVVAVIAVVRRGPAPPYTPIERLAVELIAQQAGPILQYFTVEPGLGGARQPRREVAAPDQDPTPSEPGPPTADPLRASPRWMRWSYAILLAAAAGGLLFAGLSTTDRASAGPAIVRFDGIRVTSPGEGTVAAIGVSPGARVRAGDILVELGSDREASEVAALQAEHEKRMAGFLHDPTSEAARRALSDAVARLDRARSGLAGRGARAPRDGVVMDVRVRPGMRLAAGDPLVTLVDDVAPPAALALLPSSDRDDLAAGMELRLQLAGQSGQVRGVIEEIGTEVIEPDQARRLLGDGADDARLSGPVVIVRARLPRALPGDQPVRDGMRGTGEVDIRSRPALSALIPGGDE